MKLINWKHSNTANLHKGSWVPIFLRLALCVSGKKPFKIYGPDQQMPLLRNGKNSVSLSTTLSDTERRGGKILFKYAINFHFRRICWDKGGGGLLGVIWINRLADIIRSPCSSPVAVMRWLRSIECHSITTQL